MKTLGYIAGVGLFAAFAAFKLTPEPTSSRASLELVLEESKETGKLQEAQNAPIYEHCRTCESGVYLLDKETDSLRCTFCKKLK